MGSKANTPRSSYAVSSGREEVVNSNVNEVSIDEDEEAEGEGFEEKEEAVDLEQKSLDKVPAPGGQESEKTETESTGMTASTATDSREGSRRSMLTPPEEPDDPAFRDYLKKIRFVDTLTKCIVTMYESVERPDNAIEYFLQLLVEGKDVVAEVFDTSVLEDLERQLATLEEEKATLVEKVEKHKAAAAAAEAEMNLQNEAETETEEEIEGAEEDGDEMLNSDELVSAVME